jgi:peptidoglycan/LPS O-acetylase OafA/YrhL
MNVRAIFAPFTSRSAIDYRPDIDGLRAIAVLAVVGFHYFPGRVPGGFIGVDVFFVISGYLITNILLRSLQNGAFSIAGFYGRRVRRIFPALVVILAASFMLGWAVLMPVEFKQLGKQIVAAALFVPNFLFWSQAGYFDNPLAKPLLHLWSLGIEEQFYIVWPMLLWFIWTRRWPLLSTIAGIVLVSFAMNVVVTNSNPTAGFYSPVTRAWELGLGALLACWRTSMEGESTLGNRGLSMIGLLMIGATILLLDKTKTFPGWWAAVPVLGTCLVIIAGSSSLLNRRLLSFPVLVWIGLISYPLYLWHWVLLTFARAGMGHGLTAIYRIGLILLSIVLADLTYRFVEKPIRSGGIRPLKIATLTASLAIVAVIGSQVWRNDGFPIRYNGALEAMAGEPAAAAKARKALLTYSYDYLGNALRGKCWLSRQDNAAFDACLPEASSSKRRVLIWGDSHAARLYPGAKLDADLKVGLTALDVCPPTLKAVDGGCLPMNQKVLSLVKKNPPDVVILFAAWFKYPLVFTKGGVSDAGAIGPHTEAMLQGTVELTKEIRKAGVDRVIVVGPPPHWANDLPKVVYEHWVRLSPSRRLNVGLEPDAFKLDRLMRQQSWPRGVAYFSMTDALCDDNGCLTYAPGSEELISYDYGHLTIPGAAFVWEKMKLGSSEALAGSLW